MKKNPFWMLLTLFLLHPGVYAQQQEIGFSVTPNFTSRPKVINPSPVKFYGDRVLSFNGGIDYTRMLSGSRFGYRAGIGIGIIDYTYNVNAPLNAFGAGAGEGYNNGTYIAENFAYLSLQAKAVYRKGIKDNLQLEISAGLEKKFYKYSHESDAIVVDFNRDKPYTEPPDILVEFPPMNKRLHLDVPLAVGIKSVWSPRSSFTFSVIKDWNISPVKKGDLVIRAYDKVYYGEFSPRSSYIGLNVRYSYTMGSQKNQFVEKSGEQEGGYKKALFIEFLGSGLVYSVNYDMRLKKDRNDGFGVRVGIGKGAYLPPESNINGRFNTMPINLNYVYGSKRSGIELGASVTPHFTFENVPDKLQVAAILNFGYRYQPIKEGLVCRLAYTPVIANGQIGTWAGFSIGYGFK